MKADEVVAVLRDALRPLLDSGFVIIDERYEREFGDAWCDVARGNVVVRAVRDRGQYGVELRPAEDRSAWHLAELVLPLVGVSPIDHVLDEAELAWTIVSIRDHVDQIDQLFACEQLATTKRQLADAGAMRRKQMFGDV